MLRTVILSGTEQRIASITMDGAALPLSLWNGEPKAHVAMGTQLGDGFFVSVRVFDLVSGMLGVTNTASKYPPLLAAAFTSSTSGAASHATAPLRKNSSGWSSVIDGYTLKRLTENGKSVLTDCR
jgi:hypothetical protein